MSAFRCQSSGSHTTFSSDKVSHVSSGSGFVSRLKEIICTECDTFARSGDAVFELSTRFAEPFVTDEKLTPELQLEAKKLLFHELTQVCLWGNSTDLSLLINVSDIKLPG